MKSVGSIRNSESFVKKILSIFFLLCLFPFVMSGCGATGEKTTGFLVFYVITAVFSFLLLVGYFLSIKNKNIWSVLLYCSIFIVNSGYLLLALSDDLGEALWANRVAYLGSVFLPFSMFMIINNVSGIKYRKSFTCVLSVIAFIVFIIAASPGYLDIYYKSASLININGVSVLEKIYGPLHNVYMVYLIAFFSGMIAVIIYSVLKNKNTSFVYPVILALCVFVNIGLWLIEQFVRIDFELLSVSYIISGMFILGLNLIIKDDKSKDAEKIQQSKLPDNNTVNSVSGQVAINFDKEFFISGLSRLTKTEKIIYDFYLDGASTKEIMAQLNITENTLKYHNKNIYGKLGVSSRKQLVEIANIISKNN